MAPLLRRARLRASRTTRREEFGSGGSLLAVPTYAVEARAVQEIVEELERLAKILGAFPEGTGISSRGPAPARRIAASLQKVNARLEKAASLRRLGSAGFSAIGRDFEKIGATLRAVGNAPKKTARKTTKKTARKTTARTRR